MSWVHQSAIKQRAALDRGEISSLGLLEETIHHTEQLSPYINPVAVGLYDRARAAAIAADRRLARGKRSPLCGIPITIKDSQWLRGVPCANGSSSLADFVPDKTSAAVQRLEDAGAVIFAKTTCPEFSLTGITESALYGRTSNPWDVTRTPGGSSGGAAAAVAAGMGSLSLGGDGGGSIRIPAAFCGITGFKPSHGMVPRRPAFPTWESIISYGPMARSVGDARLMFDVLAGTDSFQSNATEPNPDDLRIIVSEDLGFAPIDGDVRDIFREAAYRIESSGITVLRDHPGLGSSVVTWAIIATYDMWQYKGASSGPAPEVDDRVEPESGHLIGDHARGFIDFGSTFNEDDFADAQQRRTEIHDTYMDMFRRNRSSILVTPTLGCEAFRHGTIHPLSLGTREITYPWLDWAGFLYDANLAGMPACSIPMGTGNEGMPLSLQVTGPPGTDLEVLKAARRIESVLESQPTLRAHHLAGAADISLPQHIPTEAGTFQTPH